MRTGLKKFNPSSSIYLTWPKAVMGRKKGAASKVSEAISLKHDNRPTNFHSLFNNIEHGLREFTFHCSAFYKIGLELERVKAKFSGIRHVSRIVHDSVIIASWLLFGRWKPFLELPRSTSCVRDSCQGLNASNSPYYELFYRQGTKNPFKASGNINITRL